MVFLKYILCLVIVVFHYTSSVVSSLPSFVNHNNDNEMIMNNNYNDNDNDMIVKEIPRPHLKALPEFARWMVHSIDYGIVSTISTKYPGVPFGNIQSFADGTIENVKKRGGDEEKELSTGIPYFFVSEMDQSQLDLMENKTCSLTLSEQFVGRQFDGRGKGHQDGCSHDPESPLCSRLTLIGEMNLVDEKLSKDEYEFAKRALFQRHPDMKTWPTDHGWVIKRLKITDIWLINFFGGAKSVDIEEYYNVVF